MHAKIHVIRKSDPPVLPISAGKTVHQCQLAHVALLQDGMQSGKSSVAFLVDLPDGSIVFIETSAVMLMAIAGGVRSGCASWGEEVS